MARLRSSRPRRATWTASARSGANSPWPYTSTCTTRPPTVAVSSQPASTSTPRRAPAARASATAATLSWSVTASTSTPAAAAAATSSGGRSPPSLASVWTCRSTRPPRAIPALVMTSAVGGGGELVGLQPGQDLVDRLVDALGLGVQDDLGGKGRLVGVGHPGEVLDLPGQGLGVQPLGVAFDADGQGRGHMHLHEPVHAGA